MLYLQCMGVNHEFSKYYKHGKLKHSKILIHLLLGDEDMVIWNLHNPICIHICILALASEEAFVRNVLKNLTKKKY